MCILFDCVISLDNSIVNFCHDVVSGITLFEILYCLKKKKVEKKRVYIYTASLLVSKKEIQKRNACLNSEMYTTKKKSRKIIKKKKKIC